MPPQKDKEMKLFASSHEWVEIVDGIATVGISQYASDELSGLTYVELPEVGRRYEFGEGFASVESHKDAEEIHSPVTGTVSEVNEKLETDQSDIDNDAEGKGWICRFKDVDEASVAGLMSKEDYLKTIAGK